MEVLKNRWLQTPNMLCSDSIAYCRAGKTSSFWFMDVVVVASTDLSTVVCPFERKLFGQSSRQLSEEAFVVEDLALSLHYETRIERITDSCHDYSHRHSQRCWLDWIQENVQRSSSNKCWFLWSFSIEQKRAKEMQSQTSWQEGAGLLSKPVSI